MTAQPKVKVRIEMKRRRTIIETAVYECEMDQANAHVLAENRDKLDVWVLYSILPLMNWQIMAAPPVIHDSFVANIGAKTIDSEQ